MSFKPLGKYQYHAVTCVSARDATYLAKQFSGVLKAEIEERKKSGSRNWNPLNLFCRVSSFF